MHQRKTVACLQLSKASALAAGLGWSESDAGDPLNDCGGCHRAFDGWLLL